MENENKTNFECGSCGSKMVVSLDEVRKLGCPLCHKTAESLKESDRTKRQILKG